MKLTKEQIIVSFSFLVILIGISLTFFSISKSPKDYIAEKKVVYLDNQLNVSSNEIKNEPNVGLISLLRNLAGFEKEMSYLILFQNNLELRPTGGFVSSFATAKVKNAHPKAFHFYDTAVFDLQLSTPTQVEPPAPIKDYLWVKNWQFRDGNWSPDFPTSAQKMIEFYTTQGGQETFDGVITLTPDVLRSLLEIYGPIEMTDYSLTLTADNFLLTLEQQVEIDFHEQGITRTDRKNIMKDMAQILIQKLLKSNPLTSLKLISLAQDHLDKKDILLYFNDAAIQEDIKKLGWSGEIEQTDSDYIFIVDSNVNSFKADYFVNRNFEYEIDLLQSPAKAKLTINYDHTAQEKSWLVRDYTNWLRVYVPEGSWFTDIETFGTEPQYGKEYGKTFVAGLVKVPISSSKNMVLKYTLPENFDINNYKLFVQKQPGIGPLPIKVKITHPDGRIEIIEKTIQTDETIK
jgi:hypothetical protein